MALPYTVGGTEVVGGAGVAAPLPLPSLTKSFNSLLGLKKGIFLAGTSTRSPVLGFRPMRGLRWRVRKLPNPRISILSPARSERTMLSKMVSTTTSLSLRVNSASREISSIKSALVMAFVLQWFCNFAPGTLDDAQKPAQNCAQRVGQRHPGATGPAIRSA